MSLTGPKISIYIYIYIYICMYIAQTHQHKPTQNTPFDLTKHTPKKKQKKKNK